VPSIAYITKFAIDRLTHSLTHTPTKSHHLPVYHITAGFHHGSLSAGNFIRGLSNPTHPRKKTVCGRLWTDKSLHNTKIESPTYHFSPLSGGNYVIMVTPLTGDGVHDGMDGDLIDKQMRRRSGFIFSYNSLMYVLTIVRKWNEALKSSLMRLTIHPDPRRMAHGIPNIKQSFYMN